MSKESRRSYLEMAAALADMFPGRASSEDVPHWLTGVRHGTADRRPAAPRSAVLAVTIRIDAFMTVASGADLLDYDDVVARFDPVLGLEVHVELSTATKMFCGCATTFGAEPNTQVCPVCLGLPGSLPVLNGAAVESAIRIGLALNCEIVPWCRFARKNYFYPDMPKNYQISQYDEPIAINGYLEAPLEDGTTWRVEIERAHMEEDTGKLTHIGSETGRIEGATDFADRLQPCRCAVDRNRHQTHRGGRSTGAADRPRLCDGVARPVARVGGIRRPDGPGLDALRRQRVAQAQRDNRIRHPHRDQECQLAEKRRGRGALRNAAPGRGFGVRRSRSPRRPGTFTRPATPARAAPRRPPRTIGISPSPTWNPSRPAVSWSSDCARPFPSYRG